MNVINGDTAISLSVLAGTMPMVVTVTYAGFQLRGLRKWIRRVWTIPDQKIFAERLKSHNTALNLNVPDVEAVLETFNGKSR